MIQTSVAAPAGVFIVMALLIAALVIAGLLGAVARIFNLSNTPINGMFLAAVAIPQRSSGGCVVGLEAEGWTEASRPPASIG
jgi:hypothetical protein